MTSTDWFRAADAHQIPIVCLRLHLTLILLTRHHDRPAFQPKESGRPERVVRRTILALTVVVSAGSACGSTRSTRRKGPQRRAQTGDPRGPSRIPGPRLRLPGGVPLGQPLPHPQVPHRDRPRDSEQLRDRENSYPRRSWPFRPPARKTGVGADSPDNVRLPAPRKRPFEVRWG